MVFKKPDNFIKLFLASIIIGPGIKVYGYPLIDEYWVLMLLFGLFMRKIPQSNIAMESVKKKRFSLHEIAFIFLTLYFLFQSFRGGLWLEDIRMLRWIIFFLIVGITFFVLRNHSQSINPQLVTNVIIYSTTLYFLLYFLSGYLYELITGISKFDLQDYLVSGSSTATFPVVIYSIALIIFFSNSRDRGTNLFIFLSFIIVAWTVIYYDSRSGIFTILFFLILNFLSQIFQKNKKVKTQLFLIIIFVLTYQIWSFNYSDSQRTIWSFLPFDKEFNVAKPKDFDNKSDLARRSAPKAALMFVGEKPTTFLFGYGWYMSRYVLIEPIREMRKRESLVGLNLGPKTPYQASGSIAMLVDTGFVGIILYIINLLFGLFAILKSLNNNKYFISILYLTIVGWSFVGTITPLLLFHFWVMPNNPIILMLEKKKNES